MASDAEYVPERLTWREFFILSLYYVSQSIEQWKISIEQFIRRIKTVFMRKADQTQDKSRIQNPKESEKKTN